MTRPDLSVVSGSVDTMAVNFNSGSAHVRLHQLFAAGPWACYACGTPVVCACERPWHDEARNVLPDTATLDHIIPRTGGGTHAPGNLAVACHRCNTAKGTSAFPDQWVPDIDENTIIAPCSIDVPAGTGLAALGLAQLVAGLPRPASVTMLALASGDEPQRIRAVLDRLHAAGALLLFTTTNPPRRIFTAAAVSEASA